MTKEVSSELKVTLINANLIRRNELLLSLDAKIMEDIEEVERILEKTEQPEEYQTYSI